MGLRGPHARPLKLQSLPRERVAPEPHTDVATAGPISSAATHMRAYRRRLAERKVCITVELDEQDVETLIESGTLDPRRDCHTREALAQPVKTFLRAARYP